MAPASSRENSDDDNNGNIILRDIDIEEIAEKIVEDMKVIKLDSNFKANYVKARIAQLLNFYRRSSVDRASSVMDVEVSDIEDMRSKTRRGIRRSVTGLFNKATVDTNFVRLYDRALTEDTKQQIRRKILDNNFSIFKDKTKADLQKMDEYTKSLTSTAKQAVDNFFGISPGSTRSNGQSSFNLKSTFGESDTQMKKLVEKTKDRVRENATVFFVNPAGRKSNEEIESEKFVMENLLQLKTKFKGDLRNQKSAIDQTVSNIKSKIGNLLPIKSNYE